MFIHQRSVLPARFSSYLTAQIVQTSADPAAVWPARYSLFCWCSLWC